MGKITKFISAIICFILASGIFLNVVDLIYERRIDNKYFDEIGDVYGSPDKNQGLILQKKSAAKQDNILIFGSSELGSMQRPFYPVDFFAGKKNGFQVNLIGRGYSQSIIHSVNIGAMGRDLKDKKVVYIISPQWFSKQGLLSGEFNMNFSELQFYTFMFNKDLEVSIKHAAADRIKQLAGYKNEFTNIKIFCDLYSSDNLISKAVLGVLMPYYKFKYYLLSIKDKIRTDHFLELYSGKTPSYPPRQILFDWDEEKRRAGEKGKSEANNNEYLIENSYYDMYIRESLKAHKDSFKNTSYLQSPEYADFKLFLDICKSQGVKPLVISVPVHGRWYDYCGFDKEGRQQYYEKIKQMVLSYGFDIADFSGYEYEDYFLKDVMHLGWKGWVYVDEAIDRFYHKYQ